MRWRRQGSSTIRCSSSPGLWIEDKQHALKAGEYVFEALVTPRGVMEKLVAGKTVVHRLTVTEGMTSAEVVAALNAAPDLAGEILKVPEEGSLLPETYHYALGDNRAVLIERMQRAMARLVDELWEARDPALALDDAQRGGGAGLRGREGERRLADEMPVVAGVFHNRLRQGMRLQADPTVIYALTGGKKPLGRRAQTRRPLGREPLQHVPQQGSAAGPHRQSGAGRARRSPASGRDRRALLCCRRLRRACVREDPGRAQPQRRTLACEAGQGKEVVAEGASMGGHGRNLQHDRLCAGERQRWRGRLELGGQERQRAGAGYPLPPAAGAGATRSGGA